MARTMEVFAGADGVIRSPIMKTVDEVPRRLVRKLEPVFYESLRDKNRAGDVGARDRENNKTWKLIELFNNVWAFELAPDEALRIVLHLMISIVYLLARFVPIKQQKTLKFYTDSALTFKVLLLKVTWVFSLLFWALNKKLLLYIRLKFHANPRQKNEDTSQRVIFENCIFAVIFTDCSCFVGTLVNHSTIQAAFIPM